MKVPLMPTKTTLILLFVLVTAACETSTVNNNFFGAKIKTAKNINITAIQFDTISCDQIPSSYVGKTFIDNDTLLFVDYMFCKVFTFSLSGELNHVHLKTGRGPFELPANLITGFQKLKDGKAVIMGPSGDIYLFDTQWKRINKAFLTKHESVKTDSLITTSPNYYDIDYERNMNIQEFGDNILVPIEALSEELNPVMKAYYESSRIFFEITPGNGVVKNVLGRRSPFYKNYHYIGQFSWFNFDVTEEDNIFVCFEPDSLIYKYNSKMQNTATFGISGSEMNTNYTESKDLYETGMLIEKERKSKGYYTGLKYIDEQKLLFRSYTKGDHSSTDGLQIYKDNCLLGDINVPKGFKIMGYKEPFFYSEGFIDEEKEELIILRFKL